MTMDQGVVFVIIALAFLVWFHTGDVWYMTTGVIKTEIGTIMTCRLLFEEKLTSLQAEGESTGVACYDLTVWMPSIKKVSRRIKVDVTWSPIRPRHILEIGGTVRVRLRLEHHKVLATPRWVVGAVFLAESAIASAEQKQEEVIES